MPSLLPNSAHYDLTCQLQACQSQSRRNGKVARLPFALRQQVNRMIDDGLPYKLIIKKLGPPGRHLSESNLSHWRLGGYQDYLNSQAIKDRARTQTLAAAELIRLSSELDASQLQQACTRIALLQYIETLVQHGDQLAHDALKKNPAKMITLMNACCNLSNASLAIKEHNWPQPPPHSPDGQSAVSPNSAAYGDSSEREPNRT